MKRGLFVALEGLEGVGKSTQASMLASKIESELKRNVMLTREPGGTELAEVLRKLVLDSNGTAISDNTEALLMAAARADHVANLIFPNLKQGNFVICDRFAGSFLAYQGYGRGLDLDTLGILTHFASAGLEPDITFYLKVEPAVGFGRLGKDKDRIESLPGEFFLQVARGYDELSEKYGWIAIDASLSAEEIHNSMYANLLEVLQEFGER